MRQCTDHELALLPPIARRQLRLKIRPLSARLGHRPGHGLREVVLDHAARRHRVGGLTGLGVDQPAVRPTNTRANPCPVRRPHRRCPTPSPTETPHRSRRPSRPDHCITTRPKSGQAEINVGPGSTLVAQGLSGRSAEPQRHSGCPVQTPRRASTSGRTRAREGRALAPRPGRRISPGGRAKVEPGARRLMPARLRPHPMRGRAPSMAARPAQALDLRLGTQTRYRGADTPDWLMTVRARSGGVGDAPEPASWRSPPGRSRRRKDYHQRPTITATAVVDGIVVRQCTDHEFALLRP